ncbi:CDP-glycerol glycerophosphotransferase [Bacillus sp. BHET2]|uniref:CDP-glycerol glycerophosphotransferase family protein n=1 Tax=Bacillus sp. BHET2 TaxID=2583818 RepID=UPI00110D90BC|nr:CDP-glycerol glycerophosphotransferase family protein [Bacillus sp. BHET2]TMU84080.1 CDP-glycerol glycerophosphotransferase [Bacillus sp. BHET2]
MNTKISNKLFRTKKKHKPKLKQEINITQDKENLSIKGSLSNEIYEVEELWLTSRSKKDDWIHVQSNSSPFKYQFDFRLSIKDLMQKLSIYIGEHAFDWYIKISVPTSELSEKAYKRIESKATFHEKDQKTIASYYIRLGRFSHTTRNRLSFVDHQQQRGICYITTKGNLSFLLNSDPETPTKIQIDHLSAKSGTLNLTGKLFTRNSEILQSSIVLKGRNCNDELVSPVDLSWNEETNEKFGLNRYAYQATIHFNEMCRGKIFKEDVYDVYLKLTLHDKMDEKLIRIGRPTFRARFFIKDTHYTAGSTVSVINPYYTFKASNLSLEVYEYKQDTFNYLQKKQKLAWFHRVLNRQKDVWIVGERPYKAQDTGYHFFKYMRENHPTKNVYYVIEKDSPERRNVEPLGNVIFFKSKEHIWYSLIATKIISSHHPDYLYPIRTNKFKKAVKATKVFLQHGVMGTKNMVANYGKSAPSFDTDLFLVSSDFEKEMIINDFGYNSKEVFVTGLSRFDRLFVDDVPQKNQILIIPTWRDWISNDENFLTSEYYERYKELVHHPDLHSFAQIRNMEIIFCLHPNMQKFTSYFSEAPVTLINQGDVDVQKLLKESKLMITDYSSVGFDFSFLNKPIIYYQFDRNRFIGKRPSHLDLDKDLPGTIVNDFPLLLDKLELYGDRDFEILPENEKKADKFIKYKDTNSSARIYEVIDKVEIKKPLAEKIMEKPLINALFNKFRKSKQYRPIMERFYAIVKRVIPIDKNMILFESGIGKQYADSPRYIYEEIVNRKLPYKKIWVYNKSIPIKDEHTKQIKRLSPQYFYYLAKSGFWVNNQNFPTYIDKRKGITYLQTWHGTPLKKMLFDIDNIHGRSDDYLERVHAATKQWNYLVSPSPYATKALKSAFKYTGSVLEVGYPRNDLFYQSHQHDLRDKVKKHLVIPEDKKVILYAPTFRDNATNGKNKFVFDLKMDLQQMKERLGEEYIVLLRMHVVISNKLTIPEELNSFVYNVSNYPEIQELSLISDILITDYSSVMFDFANTNRPILFFTYDLEEYKNNIRGFYMDFEEEAPGPFVYDTEEIIQSIHNIEKIKSSYRDKYQAFQQKYCSLEDGKASKRIVDQLFE